MARKTQQVEVRMVAEYMQQQYSRFTYLTSVPLGSVSTDLMAQVGYQKAIKTMRPFRPEVDGVAILPGYMVLIEAKVWNVVNGLAKLPLYKSLAPITPELRKYANLEIIMELVVGQTNPNLERMAADAGVRVKLYNPPWLQAVVDSMNKYWTAEYKQARDQKLAMREYFGVD